MDNNYKEKDVFGLDKTDPKNLELNEEINDKSKNIISQQDSKINNKRPWLAVLLSLFFLGLGHIYGGKTKKGIKIYLCFLLIVFSVRFFAFNFFIFVGIFTLLILYYFYVFIDAYILVKRNPVVPERKFDRWYIYLVIIFLPSLIIGIIPKHALDKITIVNFAIIPTSAMNPTLNVGDYLAYRRTKDIERNEVVVFRYPKDTNEIYLKRCIGTPGDSVMIKDDNAFVNRTPIDNMENLKYSYLITTDGQSLPMKLIKKYNLEDIFQEDAYSFKVFLTAKEASVVSKIDFVKALKRMSLSDTGNSTQYIFPQSSIINWSADNFGPIYIPQKGGKVKLTKQNIEIFASVMQLENKDFSRNDSVILINGKTITEYIFKYNYYFMLGDNRNNSADSRYWGFVPENYIIGKGMYIYWSKNSSRIGKSNF